MGINTVLLSMDKLSDIYRVLSVNLCIFNFLERYWNLPSRTIINLKLIYRLFRLIKALVDLVPQI